MSDRKEHEILANEAAKTTRSAAERVVSVISMLCATVPLVALFAVVVGVVLSLKTGFSKNISFGRAGEPWPSLEHTVGGAAEAFPWGPLLRSTALLTSASVALALVLGLTTAVYLHELASDRARRFFLPILDVFSAIPPALGIVVFGSAIGGAMRFVAHDLRSFDQPLLCVVAGFVLMPLVVSTCMQALARVPASLREGAYALGADKTAMVTRVVLPAARSGILSAALLSMGRVLGEGAILWIAGVATWARHDPTDGTTVLSGYLVLRMSLREWRDQLNARASAPLRDIALSLLLLLLSAFLFEALGQRLGIRPPKRVR